MSEGKYHGIANGQSLSNAYHAQAGAQAQNAPKSPSVASAVDRIDRSIGQARNILEKLSEIANRLDPNPQGGEAQPTAPSPSGLVSLAHSRHSDLEDLLDSVCKVVVRIDRAIG